MFRKSKSPDSDVDAVDASEELLVIVDRAVNPYLVMFHDPSSFRAEQVRSLRNKLIAMNPDGESKTLAITSAMKGEGKTVTAINLALAFAELERHEVLLVDGDLREPTVEEYLHLNSHPGVGDILMERVSVSDAIRSSGVRNLSVIGAGSRLAGPSELLTTARVAAMMSRLKEDFRYVIIDLPPVLPVTDASVVAAQVDGTLLSVRLERSTRQMTRDAIRNLQDLGANVMGVFVSAVRGRDPESDPRFAYRMDSGI